MIGKFIVKFMISLLVIAIIDIPVLSQIMYPMWKKMIFDIQKKKLVINKLYAFVAYLLLALSISIFSIPQIRKREILKDSIYYGGLLGVIIYGIFDFTNLAVLKKYNLKVGIIDTLWGGLLLCLSSYITKIILLQI